MRPVEPYLLRAADLVADCSAALTSLPIDQTARPYVEALQDGVAAAAAGAWRSAAALCALVSEALIGMIYGRQLAYGRSKAESESLLALSVRESWAHAHLFPIAQFYVQWKGGRPHPERLNRHVVVHAAVEGDHLGPGYAQQAMTLAVSLLHGWHHARSRKAVDA